MRGTKPVLVTIVAFAVFLASGSVAFSEDAPPDQPIAEEPITEEPSTTTTSTSTTSTSTTTTTTAPESEPIDAPQNATAALTVTPNTGLLHFQSVTVDGTGYTADTFEVVRQCSGGATTDDDCDSNHQAYASTDGVGAFSSPFVVQRVLVTPNGTVDCASAVGACEIRVVDSTDSSNEAAAPLDFDSGAPLPSPPTLTVTPNTLLLDNQTVTVDGAGFFPNTTVALLECMGDAVPIVLNKCVFFSLVFVNSDANGDFSTSMDLRRVIVYQTERVDCANVVPSCRVTATEFPIFDVYATSADVAFDPSVPLPPPPVLIVDPGGLVHDGQLVLLRGAGYTPSASIGTAQCKRESLGGDDCEQTTLGFGTADVNSFFAIPIRLKAIIHTPNGIVDCTAAPGTCIAAAGNVADPFGEGAGALLTFDTSSGTLPNTGAPVDTLINVGAALLLAGLALLFLTRSARGRTSLCIQEW